MNNVAGGGGGKELVKSSLGVGDLKHLCGTETNCEGTGLQVSESPGARPLPSTGPSLSM